LITNIKSIYKSIGVESEIIIETEILDDKGKWVFFGILILGWLQKSSKRWKASYLTWLLTISWLEHCRQVT
jgi:hypothetical protein